MLKKLELSYNDFLELNDFCKSKNIDFLSTAFDLDSIEFLSKLDMKKWKIPSGEVTNLPYLIRVAKQKKPIILSTGMCTMKEIKDALDVLYRNGAKDITILHCTTEYPAPFKEVNLNAMKTLEKQFKLPVGYSDHTVGIEIPIAAVALGAIVIEKHFTLNRNMEGPDHKASLEPDELRDMVKAIRNVEVAMGNGQKIPTPSEEENKIIARKSIVAKCYIRKGETFTEQNITIKRPGNGISPMKWFEVLGKQAKRDFQEDELIEL